MPCRCYQRNPNKCAISRNRACKCGECLLQKKVDLEIMEIAMSFKDGKDLVRFECGFVVKNEEKNQECLNKSELESRITKICKNEKIALTELGNVFDKNYFNDISDGCLSFILNYLNNKKYLNTIISKGSNFREFSKIDAAIIQSRKYNSIIEQSIDTGSNGFKKYKQEYRPAQFLMNHLFNENSKCYTPLQGDVGDLPHDSIIESGNLRIGIQCKDFFPKDEYPQVERELLRKYGEYPAKYGQGMTRKQLIEKMKNEDYKPPIKSVVVADSLNEFNRDLINSLIDINSFNKKNTKGYIC